MTDYDRLLLVDTDVCFREDPLPWMRARAHEDEYFVATVETAMRQYRGLNTHMVFLQPSRIVFRMLVDTARAPSYIPYTGTEQDVIETVFGRRNFVQLMKHVHVKASSCKNYSPRARSGLPY